MKRDLIIRTELNYDALGHPGYNKGRGFARVNVRLPIEELSAWRAAIGKANAKRPEWRALGLSAWLRAWAALGVQHSAGAVYVQPVRTSTARKPPRTRSPSKKGGRR